MTLGGRIKQRRNELGLSQNDLAKETNLSLRTIQRIEKDQNAPRGYTIRVLAEALDSDPVAFAQTDSVENVPLNKLFIINLLVLSFLIVPFGNLIFPLLAWSKYSYYEAVDKVGRRIVNFQLTWVMVSYPLLALSPFADSYVHSPFPLIFIVLIVAYAFNLFMVWQTAARLRAGNYEVCKRAIRFL